MSAPVSAIGRGMQLGVESTENTGVAANKKFQSIYFDLRAVPTTERHRPQGFYFPTGVVPNLDFSQGAINGRGSFTELPYLFASILSYAAPAQIAATAAYDWLFGAAVSAPNTHKTYTVENGFSGSGNARKVTGVFVNELTLDISRANGVQVGGTVMGRQLQKGQTLTGSPTLIPFAPMQGAQVDVFMDAAWADLGDTKLLDDVSFNLSFGNRFAPWWTLNSANPSFAGKVNAEPSTAIKMRTAANAAGHAYLDTLRAAGKVFVRVAVTGPEIEDSNFFSMIIDMALSYEAGAEESESESALVLERPLTLVADETSGKSIEVAMVSTLTAL